MAIEQVTAEKLLERFIPDHEPSDIVQEKRESAYANMAALAMRFPDAEGIVLFENVTLDSSSLGERKLVIVGPGRGIESVAACEGKWLNDLPSQRMYPQCWVPIEHGEPVCTVSLPAEPDSSDQT